METWSQTPLAPNFVEVSNFGNVRSTRGKTKSYSPWLGHNGYLQVSILADRKRKKYLVHRLVASAHCANFDAALSVNHIDGIKTNNKSSNLEWITVAKNTALQWETGLIDLRGMNNPGRKLTNFDVAIARISRAPARVLAASFKVSESTIYKIRSGDRWAKRA